MDAEASAIEGWQHGAKNRIKKTSEIDGSLWEIFELFGGYSLKKVVYEIRLGGLNSVAFLLIFWGLPGFRKQMRVIEDQRIRTVL